DYRRFACPACGRAYAVAVFEAREPLHIECSPGGCGGMYSYSFARKELRERVGRGGFAGCFRRLGEPPEQPLPAPAAARRQIIYSLQNNDLLTCTIPVPWEHPRQ